MFETDVDVIISTSSIQNGQSIKENVLSIFVQTYIDTTSSIRQFIGRNRNRDYNIVLYVRYGKHLTKRAYPIPNNHYERHLTCLRSWAWNDMTKANWYNALNNYRVVYSGKYSDINDSYEDDFSEDNDENKEINHDINIIVNINININDNTNNSTADSTSITITNQEFSKKSELYQHYGIDIAIIPQGYEVKMRYVKTQVKICQLYKFVKK